MTRRRQITEEEAELLAHAMKDVRASRGRAKGPAAKSKPAKPRASIKVQAAKSPPVPAKPKPTRTPAAAPLTIDRRTEQKLKRGRIEIGATLDLHGLTQQAAHFRLMHFIVRASEEGHKAVLVITGKGARGEVGLVQGERRGVLREAVPLWLEQAPLRDYVHGIKPAGPRHGGGGALYVLLRRRRGA